MTALTLLRSGFAMMALGFALSSCSSAPEPTDKGKTGQPHRRDDSFWIGDQVAGSPRIVIDLSAQRARYYKGGKLVGVSPIASGREGHATPTGSFKITEKDVYHRSSIYGAYVDGSGNVTVEDVDVRIDSRPEGSRFVGAKMHYFMRVVGAVGMHEGYLPGYPASHGCIRLPTKMASIFYHATPYGTPVQIVGNAANAPYEPPYVEASSSAKPQQAKPKAKKSKPGKSGVAPGTTLYL